MCKVCLCIGYSRLAVIIGDPTAKPPIPPMFPISKSAWWAGVMNGKYPPAFKLGARTTVWKNQHLQELLDDPCLARELRSWATGLAKKS